MRLFICLLVAFSLLGISGCFLFGSECESACETALECAPTEGIDGATEDLAVFGCAAKCATMSDETKEALDVCVSGKTCEQLRQADADCLALIN